MCINIRRTRFATVLIGLLAALALPASALAMEPMEWTVTPKNLGQPAGSTPYTIGNDFQSGSLAYGNQTFGVDLKWDNRAGSQWQFIKYSRPGTRDHRLISGTESVALYNSAARQYLAYGHETFGENIAWVSTPRYQWHVAEGQITEPGNREGNVRDELYNTTEHAYLVHWHQTWGIDLGWLHAPYSLPNSYQPPSVAPALRH
jgi:hypothetical protein